MIHVAPNRTARVLTVYTDDKSIGMDLDTAKHLQQELAEAIRMIEANEDPSLDNQLKTIWFEGTTQALNKFTIEARGGEK